ncbi:putative bifunctional diguanylate cyclase/phosphodiesterase [Chelativorans sp. YIM 93263]|uniref:putative bifunctional diguanylate cyclase/phosphodiesterase n=1 Tax=Chelativorans sp. YIM 93263 TaxID=2906648 RepID=UPI002379E7D1|nr:EAL domain-containing protein [Chelativorans sp. YIM 93263]
MPSDLVETDLPQRHKSQDELRVLYQEHREENRTKTTRPGVWAGFAVYMLFSITDILLIPDVAAHTIAARFMFGVTFLAIFELLFFENTNSKWLDRTAAAAVFLAYLSWLAPSIMTKHTETMSYYMVFGAIFMMSANLFFSFRFLLSLVTSGLVLAAFVVAMMTFYPEDPSYQIAFGTFYLSCFAFTSYVNWSLNRERYKVFLNALEAKFMQKEATERGQALLRLSRTDPLTGLENRRAVDEKLRDHWDDWQRFGKSFVAILIDIDFFKKFNDHYGHQEGDRCIAHVANALRDATARYDGSIGRYGGEEFIVLARVNEREEIARFAEAIRRTVEELALPHEQRHDGLSIVTVSIGASFTRDQIGTKLEKIIHEADRALYLAKATGRNCVRLFDPNDPDTCDERENIAALLKIAVAQDLVSLVYQPILNVKTGQVDAVEALMRLKMLDGTAVPPSLFIPVAERSGAILELGRWAIRTVCCELLVDNHVPVVSVNVSPVQLKAPGFASSVAAILKETGIDGSRLAFEITEGLEMEMHSDILRCIIDLKLLGIRIWLDDFGTGFAGLSWLRLIDFDTVKVDRSFLHDCDFPRGKAMLQDIVGLLRNRGYKILVEGVESKEQMSLLREFGIYQVQGFHVGRPSPANRFWSNKTTAKRPRPSSSPLVTPSAISARIQR